MADRKTLLLEHVLEDIPREELIEQYGVSADGLRGRLSEAWDDPDIVTDLLKGAMASYDGQEGYILEQKNIIQKSEDALQKHKDDLRVQGGTRYAVFASDQHLPFIRMDYFNLLLQILDEIGDDVAFYSAFNDMLDLPAYGRWATTGRAKKAMFENNIGHLYQLAMIVLKSVKRKLPNAQLLGLLGNHDIRLVRFLRGVQDGYSEKRVLEFMDYFDKLGVLQFTNVTGKEPIIQLSDGLKWVHGVSASKLDSTIGKNTIEKLGGRRVTGDAGMYYNTVSGHVHRSFLFNYNGVQHMNTGCGTGLDPHYFKHDASRHHLGIGVSEFDTGSRAVKHTPIDFDKVGNALVAEFKGIKYSVEYDDRIHIDI